MHYSFEFDERRPLHGGRPGQLEASRRRKHKAESGVDDKEHDGKTTKPEESHSSDFADEYRWGRGGDSYDACVLPDVVTLQLHPCKP